MHICQTPRTHICQYEDGENQKTSVRGGVFLWAPSRVTFRAIKIAGEAKHPFILPDKISTLSSNIHIYVF